MPKPYANLRDAMSPKAKAFADEFYAEHRAVMKELEAVPEGEFVKDPQHLAARLRAARDCPWSPGNEL